MIMVTVSWAFFIWVAEQFLDPQRFLQHLHLVLQLLVLTTEFLLARSTRLWRASRRTAAQRLKHGL